MQPAHEFERTRRKGRPTLSDRALSDRTKSFDRSEFAPNQKKLERFFDPIGSETALRAADFVLVRLARRSALRREKSRDRRYIAAAFPITKPLIGGAPTPPGLLLDGGDIVLGSPCPLMGGVVEC
jgi:hypothetical protein